MPSSPRSIASGICFWNCIAGFLFGFIAILEEGFGYKCSYAKPTSVLVVWDRTSNGGGNTRNGANGSSDEGRKRYKVMGFVGIQTGFGSACRRLPLRQTWFPSDYQVLQRLSDIERIISIFGFWCLPNKGNKTEYRNSLVF